MPGFVKENLAAEAAAAGKNYTHLWLFGKGEITLSF
jgi:hypothetical protein